MKALITGGAGFIGSHLSQLLLDDGDEVFALDDLSTGSLENVAHFVDSPRHHLVVDSILHPAIVNELVNKVDVVYHLAAAVGVKMIVEQPVRTLHVNLGGTETVLDACCKFDKPVLVASTSEVYGDHRTGRSSARELAQDVWRDDAEALGVRGFEGDGRVPRARLPRGVRPARP